MKEFLLIRMITRFDFILKIFLRILRTLLFVKMKARLKYRNSKIIVRLHNSIGILWSIIYYMFTGISKFLIT